MDFLADEGKNRAIREAMEDFPWLDLDGLMVRPAVFHQLTVEAARKQVWHNHPYWEWTLVRQGTNRYVEKEGGASLSRAPGETFFMPAGTLHAWEPKKLPLVLDGFLLEVFPLTGGGATLLETLRADVEKNRFALAVPGAADFFAEIDREIREKKRYAPRRLRTLATDFLLRLFRAALPGEASPPPRPPGAQSRLFLLAKDWIDRELASDPSLAQIGSALGITPRTLNRIFGEVLGMPCGKYIQERKLMHGYHLLQTSPAMRIREVARRSGFDDPAYFTRAFTTRFHMAPTLVRDRFLH